jgi:hypothetical protein
MERSTCRLGTNWCRCIFLLGEFAIPIFNYYFWLGLNKKLQNKFLRPVCFGGFEGREWEFNEWRLNIHRLIGRFGNS